MKRALAALCLASPAAWAQMPMLGTSLTVRVVDESDRPVMGAFVVAREFVSVPQFHGSQTYCERGDVAPVTREAHRIELPAAGLSHLSPGRSHYMETLVYAPRACVRPSGQAGETRLRATPVTPNEERLQYLAAFAQELSCSAWSARSREAMAKLAVAVDAEAVAIAFSKYEKLIAARTHEALASATRLEAKPAETGPRLAAPMQANAPPRDFILAPAGTRVRFPSPGEPNQFVVAAAKGGTSIGVGQRAAAPGQPPSAPVIVRTPAEPAPDSKRLAIHCRHGAPSDCNLDERDAQGFTALYTYAGELNVEAVKLLIDNGANPSVAVNLAGGDAIDALLVRLISRPPAQGSAEAANAIAVMDSIAASPKASIRAGLADQLAADPSQWMVKDPGALAILLEAKHRLAALPRRPDPASQCEPLRLQRASYSAPVARLR